MADSTEFVEMEHPQIEVTALIPATDVERRKSRGWSPVTEKSKKKLAAVHQDEVAVKEAEKGGKA